MKTFGAFLIVLTGPCHTKYEDLNQMFFKIISALIKDDGYESRTSKKEYAWENICLLFNFGCPRHLWSRPTARSYYSLLKVVYYQTVVVKVLS